MKLDRRSVLIGGGAGVGLIVAFALWPRGLDSDLPLDGGDTAFGNFIKIAKNGQVTVAIPQVETGQGTWTALPQIVADELGASWDRVAVEPAPLTGAYDNVLVGDGELRITANATSVRAFEAPLREAAATAREMLVSAAADRWNVDPKDCQIADGLVLNRGRSFTFGELAEEAAVRTPPHNPALRIESTGRLIGLPLPRLDGPAKADGTWRFAADVRLPGMLYASARLAPPGGRLLRFSRDAATRMPGVRHLAVRDGWIAIVAETWWAAEQALKAANPKFEGGNTGNDLRPLFDAALASGDAQQVFSRGDFEGAIRNSRPLAATYYVAPSQHLGLEPLTATARVSGDKVELWAATQIPDLTGRHDDAFYPMPPGEPAGRAMEADLAPIAVELARQMRRPVQLTLSQSSSQNHDRLASGALARLTALPGPGGITSAFSMQVAIADGLGSALARLQQESRPNKWSDAPEGAVPPYAIPNIRIAAMAPDLPFPPGYMRGSPQRELVFFIETFIDELARAAGIEPLAFRMPLLGNNGRLARCLQGAARLAQWDGGGLGSTLGIAGASAYGSHIALVADASIGPDQQVKVERLFAAVDCGEVANRGLVEQQVEAGLIWALAQATVPAPQWVAGMPRARPIGGIALPRLRDTPQIMVQIIPSSEPPGGINGLGVSVLAPAVANAVFAASGKRMRSLPFDPMAQS